MTSVSVVVILAVLVEGVVVSSHSRAGRRILIPVLVLLVVVGIVERRRAGEPTLDARRGEDETHITRRGTGALLR